jgi:flagellar hook-length control protein FliK
VFLPPQGALGGQAALAAQNTVDGTSGSVAGQNAALTAQNTVNRASGSAADQNKAVSKGATGGVAKKPAAATQSGSARAATTAVGTHAKSLGRPATAGVSPSGASPAVTPGGQPLGTPILATPALTQSASATPGSGLATARPTAGSSGVAQQVAIRIYKAAEAGQERINIRLHPAELGRIEVRMEWAEDGVLRATISAEKSETLDLLQRDSRALDRALQEAGIRTNSGSLSFDLRGHAEGGERFAEPGHDHLDRSGPDGADPGAVEDVGETAPRRAAHDGVLDLSI